MRLANCKTVCREIDELTIDQDLSNFASEHVRGCKHCQSFYDERRNLRTLLAGLEPIEAPADFDFRVRARLASGEAERHTGFLGSRSFGVPAAALASLVLLLAAGFALRTLMSSNTGTTAGGTSAAIDRSTSELDKQKTVVQTPDAPPTRKEEVVNSPETATRDRGRESLDRIRHGVVSSRSNNRVATRDFSTAQAEVVKQDDAVASLFPVFAVETSSEPLKVSLDYETGVSRTISLPKLSFGSERALAPSGTAVKTSTKGVW